MVPRGRKIFNVLHSLKFFSPEGAPCGSVSVGALDALGSGSDLAAVRVFVGASLG